MELKMPKRENLLDEEIENAHKLYIEATDEESREKRLDELVKLRTVKSEMDTGRLAAFGETVSAIGHVAAEVIKPIAGGILALVILDEITEFEENGVLPNKSFALVSAAFRKLF